MSQGPLNAKFDFSRVLEQCHICREAIFKRCMTKMAIPGIPGNDWPNNGCKICLDRTFGGLCVGGNSCTFSSDEVQAQATDLYYSVSCWTMLHQW
jgi:hypothetical protein